MTDRNADWRVALPESEWTPFQRAWMRASEIASIRLNQQARLILWAQKQRREGGWIGFAEIADWCARVPGGVARDEGRRAQAWRDLAQSIIAGEFNRPRKDGSVRLRIAYVPPQRVTSPEPVRFRLRAPDVGNGALGHCWAPQEIWRRWFAARPDLVPPPRLAAPAESKAAQPPPVEKPSFAEKAARPYLAAHKIAGNPRPSDDEALAILSPHFATVPRDKVRRLVTERWGAGIRGPRKPRNPAGKT